MRQAVLALVLLLGLTFAGMAVQQPAWAAPLKKTLAKKTTPKKKARTAQPKPAPVDKDAAAVPEKESELAQVRRQIAQMNEALAESRQYEAGAMRRLQTAQQAISATLQKLESLEAQRNELNNTLADLNTQRAQLAQQTQVGQTQLAALLRDQQRQAARDALHVLVAGGDPNAAARNRYYSQLLAQAQRHLIETLRATDHTKEEVAAAIQTRSARLTQVAVQQEAVRKDLLAQYEEAQAALAEARLRTRSQRERIAALQRDEQQLSSLIKRLAERAAARAAAAQAAQRREAALAKQREAARARSGRSSTETGTPPSSQQTSVAVTRSAADAVPGTGVFASQKGRLLLPVAGNISARFGSAREESGASWKGLFIEAPQGAAVRAVADGQVAFAGPLRGYGNVLILDHGDGYLSVYGNNGSLQVGEGAKASAGQTIAAVGAQGVRDAAGLYFELRRQGRAFDPLQWAKLR